MSVGTGGQRMACRGSIVRTELASQLHKVLSLRTLPPLGHLQIPGQWRGLGLPHQDHAGCIAYRTGLRPVAPAQAFHQVGRVGIFSSVIGAHHATQFTATGYTCPFDPRSDATSVEYKYAHA